MRTMGKIAIVLIIASVLWLGMPFFTPFNTGNAFFDLGSQLIHVIQAWAIFGVVSLAVAIRNKRKAKKLETLA